MKLSNNGRTAVHASLWAIVLAMCVFAGATLASAVDLKSYTSAAGWTTNGTTTSTTQNVSIAVNQSFCYNAGCTIRCVLTATPELICGDSTNTNFWKMNTSSGLFTTTGGITSGGAVVVSAGKFSARNATAGISLGSAGTAFLDMPAGTGNFNWASATHSYDSSSINLNTATTFSVASRLVNSTSPPTTPVACTSPTVTWSTGNYVFQIDVGTACATSTLAITLPATTNGWSCSADNLTTATRDVKATAWTTTSVTFTNFTRTTGVAANWVDGDDVRIHCHGG